MKENPRYRGILIDENGNDIPGTEFTDWKSRSVAVAVFIECEGKFILEKRGPGCPDNIGKWCCPCGYLNWDETLDDAAKREVYEEIGVHIDDLTVVGINSYPNERQNVTVRFKAEVLPEAIKDLSGESEKRGGEKDEISDIQFFTRAQIEEMGDDEFAFGHRQIILGL